MPSEKKLIKNFGVDDLKEIAEDMGHPSYRGVQLFHELYVKRQDSFSEMTVLPKRFREELELDYTINSISEHKMQKSIDGTIKFLFTLNDGKKIESVLIPEYRGKQRYTLCISSQSGCTLNCTFCATGKLGFQRNLKAAEITDQFLFAEKLANIKITNIVFMGMGEPMYNLKNVIQAIKNLTHTSNEIIGMRRITVSTVGVPKKIYELADSGLKVKIALSLHATTDLLRQQLIPYAERVSLKEIFEAIEYYYRKTKMPITYEYIFLLGVNNAREDARRLARISRKMPSKVNIIPYHDIGFTNAAGLIRYQTASQDKIDEFIEYLKELGVNVFLRKSSGFDIDAACGQLAFSQRNS